MTEIIVIAVGALVFLAMGFFILALWTSNAKLNAEKFSLEVQKMVLEKEIDRLKKLVKEEHPKSADD